MYQFPCVSEALIGERSHQSCQSQQKPASYFFCSASVQHQHTKRLSISLPLSAFIFQYNSANQASFIIIMRSQTMTGPKFLGIDVNRVRSSDSTEPVAPTLKPQQQQQVFAASPAVKPRLTPDRQHHQSSWRTKDQASIFRSPATPSASEIPGMFEIKRSLAFDEDDDDIMEL